jgi:predicted anti-sigma-YlaC factor YlaD
MKCKNINKDLIFFAEGSLTGKRKEEISKHLSECKICRDFARELNLALKIIEKEKEIAVNPFLYSRINTKISSNEEAQNVFITTAVKLLRPVFIALLILTGIFSGFKLGSYYSEKYSYNDSQSQTVKYYLNDFQHESVESILLSQEIEN